MPESPSDAETEVEIDGAATSADMSEQREPDADAATRDTAEPILVPQALFEMLGTPAFETTPVDVADGKRVASLQVRGEDTAALGELLAQNLHVIASSRKLHEVDRAWACLHVLRSALVRSYTGDKVDAAGLSTASDELGALLAAVEPASVLPAHLPSADSDLVERAVDTSFFSGVLAAADGLRDRNALAAVFLAGSLADVGKMELPTELIDSASPLNDRDWELVRWHSHHSLERMRVVGLSDPAVLRGVAAHHERWSGGGYPYGLIGEGIPTEARFVAIADAFGALCVTRPFAERHSTFDALSEMAKSGRFEPRLVRALVLLLRSDEAGTSEEEASVEHTQAA